VVSQERRLGITWGEGLGKALKPIAIAPKARGPVFDRAFSGTSRGPTSPSGAEAEAQ